MIALLVIASLSSTRFDPSGLAREGVNFQHKQASELVERYGEPSSIENTISKRGHKAWVYRDKRKRDCLIRFYVLDGLVTGLRYEGEDCF